MSKNREDELIAELAAAVNPQDGGTSRGSGELGPHPEEIRRAAISNEYRRRNSAIKRGLILLGEYEASKIR